MQKGEDSLKITSVNVQKTDNENRTRGIASVTLDECFVIYGIRIIESESGLFIAVPSHRTNDGKYHDFFHFITPECRKQFQDAIIEEYNKIEEEYKTAAPHDAEQEKKKKRM